MTFKEAMEQDVQAVFFEPSEFGEVVVYKGAECDVQFVTEYNEDGDSYYTLLVGKYSDFGSVVVGEAIVHNGKSFRVVDARPDDFKQVVNIYLNEEL